MLFILNLDRASPNVDRAVVERSYPDQVLCLFHGRQFLVGMEFIHFKGTLLHHYKEDRDKN